MKRGRGRPRTASGPRVNVYLGSDQAARVLRKDLETIQKNHGHSSLSDSIRFLVEHWKRQVSQLQFVHPMSRPKLWEGVANT